MVDKFLIECDYYGGDVFSQQVCIYTRKKRFWIEKGCDVKIEEKADGCKWEEKVYMYVNFRNGYMGLNDMKSYMDMNDRKGLEGKST